MHQLEVENTYKIFMENLDRREHLVDSGIYQDRHNPNLQPKFLVYNHI
jgi:hypothetical protein